jgi:hypothetical protein
MNAALEKDSEQKVFMGPFSLYLNLIVGYSRLDFEEIWGARGTLVRPCSTNDSSDQTREQARDPRFD